MTSTDISYIPYKNKPISSHKKIHCPRTALIIVEAIFVVFEVICGYFAIRTMVNYQVTKFHLRQPEN
jgi:hypothetical protein